VVRNKFDTKYNLIAETDPDDDIYKEYIDYAQKRFLKKNEDYVKDVQDRNPILRRLNTVDEGDRGTVSTTTPTGRQQTSQPSEGKFSSLGRFVTPVNINRSRTISMLSGSYPFLGSSSIAGTTNVTPRVYKNNPFASLASPSSSSSSSSLYQSTAPTTPNKPSNVNPISPNSSSQPANLNGLCRKKLLSKSLKKLLKKYNLTN
jgi:hypothetical protein